MVPFVKHQLVKNIVASPFYTGSFDESMNRVLQNEEVGCPGLLLGCQHLHGINSLLWLTVSFKNQCSNPF